MSQQQVRGVRVAQRKATELDAAAAGWRKRLAPGTAADQYVDMVDVLENFDQTIIPVPGRSNAKVLLAVEDGLPPHILGHTTIDDNGDIVLAISNSTYKNMKLGYARFTAAHEIAHVKLHLRELVRLRSLPHEEVVLARANPSHNWFEDSEYQANRAAAAFLAPDDGLKVLEREGRLHVAEVMNIFGVSRQQATIRIANYQRSKQRDRYGNARGGHHR